MGNALKDYYFLDRPDSVFQTALRDYKFEAKAPTQDDPTNCNVTHTRNVQGCGLEIFNSGAGVFASAILSRIWRNRAPGRNH